MRYKITCLQFHEARFEKILDVLYEYIRVEVRGQVFGAKKERSLGYFDSALRRVLFALDKEAWRCRWSQHLDTWYIWRKDRCVYQLI